MPGVTWVSGVNPWQPKITSAYVTRRGPKLLDLVRSDVALAAAESSLFEQAVRGRAKTKEAATRPSKRWGFMSHSSSSS
jgi:hypothetical protein